MIQIPPVITPWIINDRNIICLLFFELNEFMVNCLSKFLAKRRALVLIVLLLLNPFVQTKDQLTFLLFIALFEKSVLNSFAVSFVRCYALCELLNLSVSFLSFFFSSSRVQYRSFINCANVGLSERKIIQKKKIKNFLIPLF